MNPPATHATGRKPWLWPLLGLGLLFALVAGVKLAAKRWPSPSLNAARIAERTRVAAELKASNQVALTTYDWIHPGKRIVRLPVARAMQLTADWWQDPAQGRSNLLFRLEQATAPAPEKPSIYE